MKLVPRNLAILLLTTLFTGAMAGADEAPAKGVPFSALVDEYFDGYFRHNPTAATSAGIHKYDDQLDRFGKADIKERIKFYRQWLSRFESQPLSLLAVEERDDRELLVNALKAELLQWEEVKPWETNPDRYSSRTTEAVFVIMSRTFAPAAERLKAVISREGQVPSLLESGRKNLKNPPRIYTEIALEQIGGIIDFFRKDVPEAFKEVTDPTLLKQFQKSNQGVITALESYRAFLKNRLLPRSHGDFRLGEANYRRKLKFEEMVDIPLDQLLKMGHENLRANQEQFRRVAQQLDPKHTPQEILAILTKDHPQPDKLLETVRNELKGMKEFIEAKKIITIPSQVLPIVQETPPFDRALSSASMDTPGPFETNAKEAYFNVTLPEKSWSNTQVEEHMQSFNRGTITATAIHEAYPGHYVQFLWVQRAPTKTRKLIAVASNAEGWAHYTEQMMLDEGFGNGDLKLRLGQLQDALLRNARYIVGIQMHTGHMTYEEGIQFFEKEGYQTHANAERETKRGTSDPTYLVYTLGKLQILKLREDYKKLKGEKFSLEEFHDTFMKQGAVPIALIRRAMLGNDSAAL